MDDADRVTERAEHELQVNRYQSRRDEPQAVAIGECLFCGEPLDEPGPAMRRRWCDADCRDNWEKENL